MYITRAHVPLPMVALMTIPSYEKKRALALTMAKISIGLCCKFRGSVDLGWRLPKIQEYRQPDCVQICWKATDRIRYLIIYDTMILWYIIYDHMIQHTAWFMILHYDPIKGWRWQFHPKSRTTRKQPANSLRVPSAQNPHHGAKIRCPAGDMEMKLVVPSASPDSKTQESINNLADKSTNKKKGPGLKFCITGIPMYSNYRIL